MSCPVKLSVEGSGVFSVSMVAFGIGFVTELLLVFFLRVCCVTTETFTNNTIEIHIKPNYVEVLEKKQIVVPSHLHTHTHTNNKLSFSIHIQPGLVGYLPESVTRPVEHVYADYLKTTVWPMNVVMGSGWKQPADWKTALPLNLLLIAGNNTEVACWNVNR